MNAVSRMCMKVTAGLAAASLLTVSTAGVAADHREPGCQKVRGKMEVLSLSGPCELDGVGYSGCFDLSANGSFKSSQSYFQDFWFVDLGSLGFPIPPETATNYGREFQVFHSQRGSVYGDVQYAFDIRILSGGGFAPSVIVTGGTGIYEGASGYIAQVFEDPEIVKGNYQGRICGPGIPSTSK